MAFLATVAAAVSVAVGLAVGLLPGTGGGSHANVARGFQSAPSEPANLRPGPSRPNIVFVLTDDLSMDLLPYMPQVQALQAYGMTFNNYFVSVSLCGPSRS